MCKIPPLYELLELLLQSSEMVVERANPCPLVNPHSPTRSEHRVELIRAVHRLVQAVPFQNVTLHLEGIYIREWLLGTRHQLPQENAERPLKSKFEVSLS